MRIWTAFAVAVLATAAVGCKGNVKVKVAPTEEPAPEPKEEPKPEPKPEYIEITDRIQFQTGKAALLNQSKATLDKVVDALRDNPDIELIEIEGHTDDRGVAEQNMDLSQRRAEAVREYLITKSIDGGRLEAKGYGQDNPVADNTTDDGREQNRRVQFRIVKRNSGETASN